MFSHKKCTSFRRATGDTSSDSVDTDFEADFPRGYMPRTRICEQPRIKQVTPFPIALTQKSKQISPALHTPARLCESTRIKLVTHKWGSKKDIETWHGHEQERQGSWSIWGHCQWLHFYANKSPQADSPPNRIGCNLVQNIFLEEISAFDLIFFCSAIYW